MSDERYTAADYEKILLILHEGAIDLDGLIEKTGWSHRKTNGVMTHLLLQGRTTVSRERKRGKKIVLYSIKR